MSAAPSAAQGPNRSARTNKDRTSSSTVIKNTLPLDLADFSRLRSAGTLAQARLQAQAFCSQLRQLHAAIPQRLGCGSPRLSGSVPCAYHGLVLVWVSLEDVDKSVANGTSQDGAAGQQGAHTTSKMLAQLLLLGQVRLACCFCCAGRRCVQMSCCAGAIVRCSPGLQDCAQSAYLFDSATAAVLFSPATRYSGTSTGPPPMPAPA